MLNFRPCRRIVLAVSSSAALFLLGSCSYEPVLPEKCYAVRAAAGNLEYREHPVPTSAPDRLEDAAPLTGQGQSEVDLSTSRPQPPSPPAPEGVAARLPAAGPLKLTVSEATLLALGNNQSLVVQNFNPAIARTGEQTQRAVFDPDLTAGVTYSRSRSAAAGPAEHVELADSASAKGQIAVEQFLPTGTTLGLTANTSLPVGPSHGGTASNRVGLTATQALLRGFGCAVNLASLRQARLDTRISEFELRGFAENLLAQVEETYWDYALAQRQIEIVTQSLALAERQMTETRERIRLGKLAEIEMAAAEAEVALRKEDLINARSTLAATRLRFLRLLNPPGGERLWTRDVVTESLPTIPAIQIEDVESHVALAVMRRPDLNQARLQVRRGELEVVKTRNGLLPQLDLFVTFGQTGYGETFGAAAVHTFRQGYDLQVGASFELPPVNRAARARDTRAVLSRQQAAESVTNLIQLAEVDVRSAHIEVQRTYEQVSATAATGKLQAEKVRAEAEKFNVGKSTTFLVAQAQRDLLASQIAEVQAVVSFLKAFVELYRLEGSLLDRRGIACPGSQPVPWPDRP